MNKKTERLIKLDYKSAMASIANMQCAPKVRQCARSVLKNVYKAAKRQAAAVEQYAVHVYETDFLLDLPGVAIEILNGDIGSFMHGLRSTTPPTNWNTKIEDFLDELETIVEISIWEDEICTDGESYERRICFRIDADDEYAELIGLGDLNNQIMTFAAP